MGSSRPSSVRISESENSNAANENSASITPLITEVEKIPDNLTNNKVHQENKVSY